MFEEVQISGASENDLWARKIIFIYSETTIKQLP